MCREVLNGTNLIMFAGGIKRKIYNDRIYAI